jgi:hypothetical protein
VRINASAAQVNLGDHGYSGGDGVAAPDLRRPLTDCRTGALIAKIGSSSPRLSSSPYSRFFQAKLMCVGSQTEFIAPDSGELSIGVNESRTKDNSGSFVVRIRTFRRV